MVKLADKIDCTGCSACYSICPASAINMEPDNTGFLYPAIDVEKCIECAKCEEVCPVLVVESVNTTIDEEYIARILDKKTLANSSSGAIFYALALFVIKRGGYVFGAVCDENYSVYHKSANTVSELSQFQGSKYVQSDMRNSYRELKKYLEQDKYVLFTGTPCQIYGLKGMLQTDYDKLICVDILCRSVASPLLFKKYLNMQNKELGKIQNISFKDKYRGYDYPVMKINYIDKYNRKMTYSRGSESDAWLRLFLSNEGDRPSCKTCIAEKFGHCSDITIGDFNNTSQIPKSMNDNLGCSLVIVNTDKGKSIFSNISDLIEYKGINPVNKNHVRPAAVSENKFDKKQFYEDAKTLDGKDFYSKYYPITKKVRLLRILREMLYYTGIYSVIKILKRKKLKL